MPVKYIDPSWYTDCKKTNKVVRFTLQQFDFKAVVEVSVSNNLRGIDLFKYAIEAWFDNNYDDENITRIEMTNDKGETHIVFDGYDRQEEWFRDLVVSAELIYIEPTNKTIFED